jgi:hypothetical protein
MIAESTVTAFDALTAHGLTGVTQTVIGRGPEHNEPCGNCLQAALATILGLPLDEVPHFLENGPAAGWWDRMNAWLIARFGVALLGLTSEGGWEVPPVLHLMQGRTIRDSEHVVVGFAGRMVWDPHPSRAGLVDVKHHEMFVSSPARLRLR